MIKRYLICFANNFIYLNKKKYFHSYFVFNLHYVINILHFSYKLLVYCNAADRLIELLCSNVLLYKVTSVFAPSL